MSSLNVGGHLSLGRTPRSTVEWAGENGFNSMQIFASSPAAWKPPVIDERRAADFVLARAQYGINPLVIHAIYLINLASENPALVARSKGSLRAAMKAGAALGATGVVTHIGSHGGRGFEEVAGQVGRALLDVVNAAPDGVQLILENSAGAGGLIGSGLEQLRELLDRAGRHARLSVALDTAHLCGAGWDFQQPGAAPRLVKEVEHTIGLDRLILIHANDSAAPCGSHKDRHANIGKGHIGLEGFRNLLAQAALRRLPWILETPNLEQRIDDLANLRALSIQPLPTGSLHAS